MSPYTSAKGTPPIPTTGDNPNSQRSAGNPHTLAEGKQLAHMALCPKSFPFPPPYPGAAEETRSNGAATPTPTRSEEVIPRNRPPTIHHTDPKGDRHMLVGDRHKGDRHMRANIVSDQVEQYRPGATTTPGNSKMHPQNNRRYYPTTQRQRSDTAYPHTT